LIHGGAGGVGLSAIQIAQWLGARVIATAGTPEKREFLRVMGVDHVLDSRSLEFVDEINQITNQEGVDVVLNSLSGEAMERSLSALKPFGRFCELGKRDYYANTRIGLRPFRRNLSYFGIDADQLLSLQPKLADQLFSEMVTLFETETLRPLPYRKFAWQEAVDAFRLMQQSGHIGKIIVVPPQPNEVAAPGKGQEFAVGDSGSHLIVGGLGGFGIEIARWLADCGAKSIVLTSRRGVADENGEAALEELRKSGVDVQAKACDTTDSAQLGKLIEEINQSSAPLQGVIHAAMVLDDALLSNLSAERFEKVLRPKVDGAMLLDNLTADLALDYFVLFSSMTTFIGNPGQANYVAANGFLETLCQDRRQRGQKALAVAWGAIGDAGYLTRNADVGEMLAKRMGGHALGAREGLDLMAQFLAGQTLDPKDAVIAIGRIDWASAKRELAISNTPMLEPLMRGIDISGGDDGDRIDVAALIAGKDAVTARDIVAELLTAEVAKILRLPAEDVNRQRPLSEIGMDSLMALELRTAVQQRLGLDVPAMAIADGTTLNDIATRLVGRVSSGQETAGSDEVLDQLVVSHVGDAASTAQVEDLIDQVSKQTKTARKAH
jgi:NAD(P)-dependent dehydrogenase (short-subunit alcohol dehydrogenase family)/acyl carrier protein